MSSSSKNWPKKFPKKEDLKKDIDIMVSCFKEVLFRHEKKSNIYGIYFKGSAHKRWDSVIDYVPGISDIDIHFILRNPKKLKNIGLDEAFIFSSELKKLYKSKNKNPVHTPIVQMNLLNDLMEKDFYSPTPKSAVEVIYGKDYPLEKIDMKNEIKKSKKKIMDDAGPLSEKFPMKVIDKTNGHAKYLQDLAWKISPTIPNYLFLKTRDYEKVWSMNRTEIAKTLRELGEKELAENYVKFYTEAWNYYLNKSEESLISALKAGYNVLKYLAKKTA